MQSGDKTRMRDIVEQQFMISRINIFSTLVVTIAFITTANADPFLITAKTTSGTPESTATSGSNLPNLVSNLVNGTSQFSTYSNRDFSAAVKYGSESNAILLSKNAANTSAIVSIPSIGFSKTFTGTSAGSLESQIENFAKKDGAEIYGDFIRSINENTTLGVTDGNPLAATALFADAAFSEFGLSAAPFSPGEGAANPLDLVATPNIRLDLNGGYSRTDSGNGYYAGGEFSFGFKFGSSVGLVFTTPFEYRYVSGAAVYDIAEEVSLPIVILPPQGSTGLSWMLTPTVFAGGAGSVDLASGGLFVGGGITSSLSLQYGGLIFTLGDQFNYAHGFPVTIGDYKFDTNLDQEIFKNGVKVTHFFGSNLFVDAGITYTDFVERAAVREYWTPTAGIGLRMSPNSGIRIGYSGDFGPGYIDEGGAVTFYLNY